ncbi:hypothetical protein FACS1894123_11990 [Bacteroidia bacterium]|nr:hypothetical protein FACS1894123_11990 [Bacteroidia bacterium]
MKTKNLILFFGILLLSFGCSDNDDLSKKKDINYQETILGKWELIASGHTEEEIISVTPNGSYTEYFSNGKISNYNSFSKKTEEKDAFNSFPILKMVQAKDVSVKTLPSFNIEKLLSHEGYRQVFQRPGSVSHA